MTNTMEPEFIHKNTMQRKGTTNNQSNDETENDAINFIVTHLG